MRKDEKTKQAIRRQKNKMTWQVPEAFLHCQRWEKMRNPVITDIGTPRTSVGKIKDDE